MGGLSETGFPCRMATQFIRTMSSVNSQSLWIVDGTSSRATSRHFDHSKASRVSILSLKRPYGLTCSQMSGVRARRSVASCRYSYRSATAGERFCPQLVAGALTRKDANE